MINKSIVYDKAYRLAIRSIKLYRFLMKEEHEYLLSKQLMKCGTSIGANIAEANGAVSKADFSSKISIAYKECLETKYWLSLLKDTSYIDDSLYKDIFAEADEIGKMLFSIIKTTRISTDH